MPEIPSSESPTGVVSIVGALLVNEMAKGLLTLFFTGTPTKLCEDFFSRKGVDFGSALNNLGVRFIDPNGDRALLGKKVRELGQTTGDLDDTLGNILATTVSATSPSPGYEIAHTIHENGTVYLGELFYKQDLKEQQITVVHEMLHAYTGEALESGILNKLGVVNPGTGKVWDASDNRGAPDALDNFLRSGCQ
jgi:hypothetical protein